jgi:acyl-CoA thioesterase II
VKSLHTLFAREGRAAEPVTYDVIRQHEGRTFATLAVSARQGDVVIASAAVAMHAAEDGPAHQYVADIPAVPGPEHRLDIGMIPWDPYLHRSRR